MTDTTVYLKSKTDDTATVEGYGVVFGGVDLEGETFSADTDYMLDLVPRKPVLYDHTLTEVDHKIGTIFEGDIKADEKGVWIEAQLDRHAEYVDAVLELVDEGVLGWSSGTVGHLARRDGKSITAWPIVEFSLTPTPAEPRTLGVERVLKHLTEGPILKTLTAEADRTSADRGVEEEPDVGSDVTEQLTEDLKMDEETKVVQEAAPAVEYATAEQVNGLLEIVKGWTDAPAKAVPGLQVEDEADRALKGNPYRSFGEFLMSVKDASQGLVDQRLLPIKSNDPMDEGGFSIGKAMGDGFVGSLTSAGHARRGVKAAPTGMGESLPAAGGFLVDSDRQTGILARIYETGELLSRVAMDGVGPNSNGMTYYAEAETSRVAGSRHGGIRGYWMAENSAITASAPTFRTLELKLKKVAALVYATDELLADVSALESYVMRMVPDELRFMVEESIINGLGSGSPLGIVNAPGTVSQAKETGQAAATIVVENILKMWSRLWARSQRNAVWLVSQDAQPQLWALSLDVGTGGQLVWQPPGGLSGSPYATLFGRPVIVHESCATLGTVGDIILMDPTEYQMIEKGGIESASSIHVRFTQGEQTYRFVYRVDGQPIWHSALTPHNSGSTVSPYITLATRA